MASRLLPIILAIIALSGRPSPASSEATPAAPRSPFIIGYLLSGSDLERPLAVMEALRAELLKGAPLRDREILLRPCDGPPDMEQRLRAEEFDLAFATTFIYARLFRSVEGDDSRFEPPLHEPILQYHDIAGDFVIREIVYRQGVVFAGPGSPLFGVKNADKALIRAELERERMAVPEFHSETGYIYPRLEIYNRFSGIHPLGPLFCRSAPNVVKHVVSGLANIGACDARVLATMLGDAQAKGELRGCTELFRTKNIPTGPVLLRGSLHPRNSTAPLGRELRDAIQQFFNSPSPPAPGLRLERINDRRAYEDVAGELKALDEAERAARAPKP